MLDRSVAPPYVKTTSFDLIEPEVFSLPNGVSLFFVPGGSQDVLKIELIFFAGKWFEEKKGAGYFAANLLPKGTLQKSSFEVAQVFDQYGAHLEISPGLDVVSVAVYSLAGKLEPVLNMLMEFLGSPAFSEKEFEQYSEVYLQNLKVNNEKTGFLASKLFRKNLFGESHPYGYELEEADVRALTTRDLRAHYNAHFAGARVFVSGKISQENKQLIRTRMTALATGQQSEPVAHQPAGESRNLYQPKKDSVQSSVRLGKRTLMRRHPDYVTLLFATHILGGYFGSRLMKNIREDKGLTYGISASIHSLQRDSYLVIGADVNKENVALTFEEIRKELKTLGSVPISAGELETARNHFIGSLQSEITTPFAHADKIKTINLYGVGADYYRNMIRKIEQLTPEEILAVSASHLRDDSVYEVSVG